MERFEVAAAIAQETAQKLLVIVDGGLGGRITNVAGKTEPYGVQAGMSGKEALEKISGSRPTMGFSWRTQSNLCGMGGLC